MMTAEECLARAIEFEEKMQSAEPEIKEEYGQLAAQWRMLADIAGHDQNSRDQ
jgi:hypothetical protein